MLNNIIAFIISSLLLLLYYFYLHWQTRRCPDFTVHAMNAKVRQQWVEMIMTNGKMEILAVQTLRNSVMASNFMASTAVLLIIGILNLSENTEKLTMIWQPLASMDNAPHEFYLLKLALLLLDFFIAFYCFSMAIRFFNHVGYMVNLPLDSAVNALSAKQVSAYLNRAGTYYTFGTRAFFFSLPLILWFLGAYFLVMATAILIISLYSLDIAPPSKID